MRHSYKSYAVALLLTSFLLNFNFLEVNAQDDLWTPDDLTQNLKEAWKRASKDEVKQVGDDFLELWEGGAFMGEEEAILSISEQMFEKRFRVNTDLYSYYGALVYYKKNADDPAIFDGWHDVLGKLIEERSKRNFVQFNESMMLLFQHKALAKSNTRTWGVPSLMLDIKWDEEAESPFVDLKGVDLMCFTSGDSIQVRDVDAYFLPLDQKVIGRFGVVDWEAAGLPSGVVYAELQKFEVDTRLGDVKSDSAKFFHKDLFQEAVWGSYENKVFNKRSDQPGFPKFRSYGIDYKLENILPNVNYYGGFSLEGKKIVGIGRPLEKSHIKIYHNGEVVFRGHSERFTFSDTAIHAAKVGAALLFQEDSIYHPQVRLRYLSDSMNLRLTKMDVGMSKSPFYNYHQGLQIQADIIEWRIPENDLGMRMFPNALEGVRFVSNEYYSETEYQRVQSILEWDPLLRLKGYAVSNAESKFTLEDFANYAGAKPEQIERLVVQIGMRGFLIYDPETKVIELTDKIYHYIDAYKGKVDFDNMQFQSVIKAKDNVKIDPTTGEMQVEGVGKITISDSQQVFFFPKEQSLKMGKNRDMEFDGQIIAGRFHFFGGNFSFNYDSFQVGMDNVDSLRLYFPEEKDGQPTGDILAVKTVIQEISGTLYINDPDNKSNKEMLPQYPIFDCNKESTVYYDKKTIFDGVYEKDRLYFTIDPFVVDSLTNFTKEGVRFNGSFFSDGIFPEFEEDLYLQDDLSLGFIRNTPPDGFPLYKGKGQGDLEIRLSHAGLRGGGVIDYLVSTTRSDDYMFFPDSMNAMSNSFDMAEKTEKYPAVSGEDVYSHWKPYGDSMVVQKREKPIQVYEEDVFFDGDLILTPDELKGLGEVNYANSNIVSEDFTFKPDDIQSDSADFKLKDKDSDKEVFASKNINFKISLEDRFMEAASNEVDSANTLFSQNQTFTNINTFTWDVEKERIEMKTERQELEDAYLLADKGDGSQLKLNSGGLTFDLSNFNIEAKNVQKIKVADALVLPKGGEVTIGESAEVKTLENAIIKADTNYVFHEFYDASVNIFDQSKYTAKGYYDYVGKDEAAQPILFERIASNEEGKTMASGKISDSLNFFLDPNFIFRGEVFIEADISEIIFDGASLPTMNSRSLSTSWFVFRDSIDAKEVEFKLNEPKDEEGEDLYTGYFYSNDTINPGVYPLFMGKKRNAEDKSIASIRTGVLKFDYDSNAYVIDQPEQAKRIPEGFEEIITPNPYYYIDGKTNDMQAYGKFDLGIDGEFIDFKTAGLMTYTVEDSLVHLDLAATIEFPFVEDATQMMADSILELGFYQPEIDLERPTLYNAIFYLIEDPKIMEEMMFELVDYGVVNVQKRKFNPMILLTDLSMIWDREEQAFVTDEHRIGLSHVDLVDINRMLRGALKIKPENNLFEFYIEGVEGNFYYYTYSGKTLQFIASDLSFFNEVEDNKKKVTKKGYRIEMAELRQKDRLIQRSGLGKWLEENRK